MSPYILDTDTLSLYQHGLPPLLARVDSHHPGEMAITVISVEEEITGWYSLLRKVRSQDEVVRAYDRLSGAIPLLARWRILSMTRDALTRYDALRRMNLNVGKMDLKIAAIVLESGGTLVSRNLRDFRRIPGLLVEDWAA